MAQLFKVLQPLQFMQTILNSGTRPDGRKFDESRQVLISCDCVTTANGSSLIKFGTSSVMCGITTSLVKPNIDKPNEGIIELDVRFSNTCTNDLDNPDRTIISGYVRECIKKILFHSKFINLEQLCLISHKYCWKLSIEIICLNMDGSIIDLSLLSILLSLTKCKLRKYEINTEFDIIKSTNEYEKIQLKTYPILMTFVIIDKHLLIDPTMNEEELSDTTIRIAIDSEQATIDNNNDCIYLLEITGSKIIDKNLLKNIYTKAIKRSKSLLTLLNKYINDNNNDNEIMSCQFESIKT